MYPNKNKSNRLKDDLSIILKRYKLIATFFFVSITCAFWLGTYYEEIKKDREITEIENKKSMELLQQKEQYMNKYFDLRETYLNDSKNNIYGNKKYR